MSGGTVEDSLATRAGRLFALYRDGDEARMGELVKILTPILWHTARASRLDTATTEDVLQTVWLTLIRKADTIAEPLAVLQWMVVSTKREAWRVARAQTRVRPEDLETTGTLTSDSGESVEDAVLRATRDGRLWQHVEGLPERCRALLRVIAFADRPDYARARRGAGYATGQHRSHPRPVPGQVAARPRRRPQLGDEMTTADDDRLAIEERLAAEPLDREDLAVLNSLRAYYDEHDPIPDGLVERIQFELTLDALQAEVATLTQLDLSSAGARSASTESVRTITFTSESMTTMVTITPDGEGSVRIDGWAAPGAGYPGGDPAGRRGAGDDRRRRRPLRVRAGADRAGQVRAAPGGRRVDDGGQPDDGAVMCRRSITPLAETYA